MMSKHQHDDDLKLPAQLEHLRAAALELVGADGEIVNCGQVDFDRLERVLDRALDGTSKRQLATSRREQLQLLSDWLAQHRASREPLVVGLRFVAAILQE